MFRHWVSSKNRVQVQQIKSISHRFKKCVALKYGDNTYNISYLDVGSRQSAPIVALHGAPGQASDFQPLFDPLSKAGYRVIAIDFPGTQHCQFFGVNETVNLPLVSIPTFSLILKL